MYKQIIYYGAPGTGKSFLVDEIIKDIDESKKFRVTIHPEYSYSDFIGQLLPIVNEQNGVDFKFNNGPFTLALVEAYKDASKDVYLILEELSRGNVASIFGDIFQLLDRNHHFQSRYSIHNKDIANEILTLRSNNIILPSNFNIICTVNTNDQNVYPMDTAFKRRFTWSYVPISPVVDRRSQRVIQKLNNPLIRVSVSSNQNDDIVTNWQSLYMALNSFIIDKKSGLGKNEDKQVGQFFIEFGAGLVENSYSVEEETQKNAEKKVNELIKSKLLMYLWQDVQGNFYSGTSKSLFSENVNSFEDLYNKFGVDSIFNEIFIEDYLKPNKDAFPYEVDPDNVQ